MKYPWTPERTKNINVLYQYEREYIESVSELMTEVGSRGLGNSLFLKRKLNLFIHFYSYIHAIFDEIKMRKRMIYYNECINACINTCEEYNDLLEEFEEDEGD